MRSVFQATTLARVARAQLRRAPNPSRCSSGYSTFVTTPRTYSALGIGVAGLLAAVTAYELGWLRPVRLDSANDSFKARQESAAGSDSGHMIYSPRSNTAPVVNAGDQTETYIPMKEVARHNLAQDAWVVVDGKVYDVTDFHKHHPGGSAIIVGNAGRDVTELFGPIHPPGTLENNLAPELFKGVIDPAEAERTRLAYQAEQQKLKDARDSLPAVETMLGIDELEEAAKSCMTARAVDYYSAGSCDGHSVANNKESFRKCRLVPRVLRDVSSIRPQTMIFGIESPLPIYVAPASNAVLGHPDGELNITQGASATGIVQAVSAAASYSLTDILDEKERVNEESGRKMGMVYQVYFQRDRSKTEAQVREAVEGGVQALVLTVDSNVGDHRQSTEKLKGSRGSAEPGVHMDPITTTPTFHDSRLNWADIPWLQELADGLPIYLKGVCHIDDVRRAKEIGLAGCILSNHGGRQLDQARSGFESLRSIHAEDPQLLNDFEVYVDGGIRRGSDVLKALALGAKGVGLGRPFLYAQAAYGDQGVIRAVRILENEIVTGMRLLGLKSINEITPNMVECLQEVWK